MSATQSYPPETLAARRTYRVEARRQWLGPRCHPGLSGRRAEIRAKQGRHIPCCQTGRDGTGICLAHEPPNQLLYDDMDGGELLELSEHFMDEEIPAYLCGGYEYNLDVITSASNPMLDYSSGVGHDFFSVILAYDVHSQASFDEVSRLYDSICPRRNMGQPEINILVLGLKADLDSTDGRVPREAGESFAKERGCSFAECSARSGDGVYEAFGMVVEYAYSITMQFTGDFQGRISVINESRAHLRRAMERLRME